MEEMISEKNDLEDGSSSSSKPGEERMVSLHNHTDTGGRSSRTFGVLITECRVAHVRQLDVAL